MPTALLNGKTKVLAHYDNGVRTHAVLSLFIRGEFYKSYPMPPSTVEPRQSEEEKIDLGYVYESLTGD